MIIEFNDLALEDLYCYGSTKDPKYRKLSKNIIKQYVKTVNYIKSVQRIEDLYYIKSLHYEKKKGDLKGSETVWINGQYRLLFSSLLNESGILVKVKIDKRSKHYE